MSMTAAESTRMAGAGAPALMAREVRHYFSMAAATRPFLVLSDIDLEIPEGAFVSLVGPSGCGKSTLLRVFAGLIVPTYGRAELKGEAITGPNERKGMVFQEDAVFPWLNVRDNVEFGLKARGVAKASRDAIASRWIETVGLKGFEGSFPRELSGGMRKRVDLARVYASDPEVLLMDEPFGALDAMTKLRLQEELLRLWDQSRKTVVFVTHDLDEAVYLSDFVVVMAAQPGRISSIHPIDLPRPRHFEMRATEKFTGLAHGLWSEIERLESQAKATA
jgi:NitT/TauT family transport system ATP-binding protein